MLPQTLDKQGYQRNPDKDDYYLAINIQEHHEECIDRNPEVVKDNSATKNTHKGIVVRDIFVVLVAKHG